MTNFIAKASGGRGGSSSGGKSSTSTSTSTKTTNTTTTKNNTPETKTTETTKETITKPVIINHTTPNNNDNLLYGAGGFAAGYVVSDMVNSVTNNSQQNTEQPNIPVEKAPETQSGVVNSYSTGSVQEVNKVTPNTNNSDSVSGFILSVMLIGIIGAICYFVSKK